MSVGLLHTITHRHPEGLILWPPWPRDIPSPTPGSDEGMPGCAAGGPILRPVSVCPKPCVSLQMGVDLFVLKNQPKKSNPTLHPVRRHSITPIHRFSASHPGALYREPRALACHWPHTGPRCGRPPGKRLIPTRRWGCGFAIKPKIPENHSPACCS